MRELIVGGARSGKSSLALPRAHAHSGDVVYVATARLDLSAGDPEMQARIDRHRSERPAHWQTVECPVQVAACLQELGRVYAAGHCLVVDCLTLWLSNVLFNAQPDAEQRWRQQRDALLECLPKLQTDVVLVSNEVGWGIVPDNALARHFRDEQGWLNQQVAKVCERVTLIAAGLPITLKAP